MFKLVDFAGHACQDVPSQQLIAYTSLLQKAKRFIKQRRHELQLRQSAAVTAQQDWKAALTVTEQQQQQRQQEAGHEPVDSAETTAAVEQLRHLKHVLQSQIHQLNQETRELKALKTQVSPASQWCLPCTKQF